MDFKHVKFSREANADFINTLRKRVNEYFKDNKISKFANAEMILKTICMLGIYFVPYVLLLLNVFSSYWVMLALWFIMGIGMSGVGTSIMHDAIHGAYSKNKFVNKILGQTMVLLGGYYYNWELQHNVLHHSYTNIDGLDEDIDSGSLFRFSPNQELKKHHKLQYLYCWPLYALMTLEWSTTKDFKQLIRYKNKGLLKMINKSFSKLMGQLILLKSIYYAVFIVLPLILIDAPWYITTLGVVIMHLVCGFALAVIFQPAHVVPETEFMSTPESGTVENNWAVHQILTTTNFAPKNRILNWFIGGLNYQIEHHLFPNICHVHYRKISEIVKKTANEFDLPYHCAKTFRRAVLNHGKMLYRLGQKDYYPAV
jgi:linoleoyl-CoA desaturase